MKKTAAVLIIAMLLSVAAAAATGINLDAVFESDLGFTGLRNKSLKISPLRTSFQPL